MTPVYLLAERTEDMGCPAAAAYRYATNLEHFGDWFPGVLSIVSANDHPHGEVGKEYAESGDSAHPLARATQDSRRREGSAE
jgi:hypothetical protein